MEPDPTSIQSNPDGESRRPAEPDAPVTPPPTTPVTLPDALAALHDVVFDRPTTKE